jgi:hypothetical protein
MMGFLERLFGTEAEGNRAAPRAVGSRNRTDDEIAVERYRYLLRTAPPETIEQVHSEAFSKLTPKQRDLLFAELTANAAPGDAPKDNAPASLAVSATRSELRNPGTMERSMAGGAPGFGSTVASSLLGTVAGYVIGSALVSAFMPDLGATEAAAADPGADPGAEAGADASGDTGGGFGDFGDFGGGDFGF